MRGELTSMEKKSVALDSCEFLRRRALALLDEGLARQAARLLRAVDREQTRRILAQTQPERYPMAN